MTFEHFSPISLESHVKQNGHHCVQREALATFESKVLIQRKSTHLDAISLSFGQGKWFVIGLVYQSTDDVNTIRIIGFKIRIAVGSEVDDFFSRIQIQVATG